jgi:hypothetical protein
MTELINRIIATWQDDAVLSAINGPYAYAAPPTLSTGVKIAYPYAYFAQRSKTTRHTYEGIRTESPWIRFRIFHTDLETLHGYHERLLDFYPRQNMGWDILGALKVYDNIDIVRGHNGEPALSADNKIVYLSLVDWEFTYQAVSVNIG